MLFMTSKNKQWIEGKHNQQQQQQQQQQPPVKSNCGHTFD